MRKLLTLLLSVFAFVMQANAQVRNIDLEVKLLEPQTNDISYVGQQFNIKTSIKNLGPDTLTQNDTVAFGLVFNGSSILFGNPPVDHIDYVAPYLLPGDSVSHNIQFTLNQGWTTGTTVICSKVIPHNAADSIREVDTTNNINCATVDVRDPVSVSNTTIPDEIVEVYPNPANDVSYFEVTLDNTSDVQITITDMTGRVVITNQQMQLPTGVHKIKVATDKLPTGNYLYRVHTNGMTKTGKLQIE